MSVANRQSSGLTVFMCVLVGTALAIGLFANYALSPETDQTPSPEWSYLCRSGGITLVAGTGNDFSDRNGFMKITDSDTGKERYISADCLVDKI